MRYDYHPGSPNCRTVTAVLDLLGVDAERHLVDLPRGEQLQPAFLAINRGATAPHRPSAGELMAAGWPHITPPPRSFVAAARPRSG